MNPAQFIAQYQPVMEPLLTLGTGILILIVPRLLNYIVAVYFIVIGVMGFPHWNLPTYMPLESLIPLVAGIVILIIPRFLNYAVAITLILLGALGLF